jgi:sortase B
MKERLKSIPFCAFIAFSLLGVVLLFMVGKWAYTNIYLNNLLSGVQDKEVVGVEMQSPEALGLKKKSAFPFAEVDFTDLKKKNPDTVAWLKLSSINLDIPIVQTVDNEYYLTHDIDKRDNSLGWVFADVRSNIEHPGINTVLYGHNAVSKQMFGSLKNLYNIDKERVATDGLIQFTTPTKQMVYEIVSVYVTEYDDWQYVNQIFTSDDEKRDFISRMVEKNEVKAFSDANLSVLDNFLTFSTCYGSAGTTKRLVVHAKLVAEKG